MTICHIMSTLNILTDLCVIRHFLKIKKTFASTVYNVYSSKRVLVEPKEVCLEINGKLTVKLKSILIKFKNYFKELAVSFKIYADF